MTVGVVPGIAPKVQSATYRPSVELSRGTTRSTFQLGINSVVLTAAGFGFWVLIANLRGPAAMAEANGIVSLAMFLGGASQFNLCASLPAVLPAAGPRAVSIYTRSMGATAAIGMMLGGLAVAVGGPVFGFPVPHGVMAWLFPPLIAMWTWFSIQDAALAATGRSSTVLTENVIYVLARVAVLAVALLWLDATDAALVAWYLPAGVAVAILTPSVVRTLRARSVELSEARVGRSSELLAVGRGDVVQAGATVRADAAGAIFDMTQTRLLPYVALIAMPARIAAVTAISWLIWATVDQLLHTLTVPATAAVSSGESAAPAFAVAARIGLIVTAGGAIVGWFLAPAVCAVTLGVSSGSPVLAMRLTLLAVVPRVAYRCALGMARSTGLAAVLVWFPVLAALALAAAVIPGLEAASPVEIAVGALISQLVVAVVALGLIRYVALREAVPILTPLWPERI